eukprot:scaffold49697_cov17-Tisochrysis_lutea.AAC.2
MAKDRLLSLGVQGEGGAQCAPSVFFAPLKEGPHTAHWMLALGDVCHGWWCLLRTRTSSCALVSHAAHGYTLQAVFALEKELIAARNAEKATQAEAHRASTYRANIEILEERRNHILAKIDAATELSRQKEELHKVEMEIKVRSASASDNSEGHEDGDQGGLPGNVLLMEFRRVCRALCRGAAVCRWEVMGGFDMKAE